MAGLFVWLGVATLKHAVLAASCFLAALVILFPGQIKRIVSRAEESEGWKRRAAYGVLGTLFVLCCVVVIIALTVDRELPPGSP